MASSCRMGRRVGARGGRERRRRGRRRRPHDPRDRRRAPSAPSSRSVSRTTGRILHDLDAATTPERRWWGSTTDPRSIGGAARRARQLGSERADRRRPDFDVPGFPRVRRRSRGRVHPGDRRRRSRAECSNARANCCRSARFQAQPAQSAAARCIEQLHRFLGTKATRKIRYGRHLAEAVIDLDAVPYGRCVGVTIDLFTSPARRHSIGLTLPLR